MEETLLLTVELAAQSGEDVLISPALPPDQYTFDRNGTQRIKIITPDQQVIEKDAEISIALGTRSDSYFLLIPKTQKDEIPVGSQIWIRRSEA